MQNIQDIMRMAQNVQQQLADAQGKLDQIEVEGAAGGGMVKVKASAKGRIIGVSIDPSLLNPGDKEVLEDLVAAAFNDARTKADAVSSEEMQKMTGPAAAAGLQAAALGVVRSARLARFTHAFDGSLLCWPMPRTRSTASSPLCASTSCRSCRRSRRWV